MKILHWLALASLASAIACQPQQPSRVAILDGQQIRTIVTNDRVPATIAAQAGWIIGPADRILCNGVAVGPNQALPFAASYTLQIQRAFEVTINSRTVQTTASTVGEVLSSAGAQIYAVDRLDPPADTPVAAATRITYVPSQQMVIQADGKQIPIRSSAAVVGSALAQAGMPLIGLDSGHPAENAAPPKDGQIGLTRISESLVLAQKSIPFTTDFQASADVELDHQQVLQPGQLGLVVSRTRIQFQDGKEVSRQIESQTVVRPPQDRVVAYGTKVVVHTATVDGVQISYWRAVQMFTTAYSPCNSGGDRCYPGTSSGKVVQKGVVAVKYSWYLSMQGQALYVPGYGYATIEDVCGGCVGKPWVDLGYTDAQFALEGDQWGKFVTVYFLAPAPANIVDVLQ